MAEAKKITKDEAMAKAVKAALNGGRHYGSVQQKIAITSLANMLDGENDDAIIAAIVALGNVSATQQRLAKAGYIDRATREAETSKKSFIDLLA